MMNRTMAKRMMAALAAMMLVCTGAAAEVRGVVTAQRLVLRKTASKDGKALQTLDRGDRVTIRSECGDWYRVSYGKYGGYVMKEYVDADGAVTEEQAAPASAAPAAAAADAEVRARIAALGDTPAVSRLGDSGDKVRMLQRALAVTGYFTDTADGDFGPITESAVRAFQQANGLDADGIAGAKTIRRLFGHDPAEEPVPTTERLDWFNGGSSVIPKGAYFTVKDVKTGKTFRIKRWAGVYHLDAEPATAADTAIMKSVYGGAWSWSRRAILVSYKDHVYAASMNGMPHGTQTILDNDFKGQFCIHFYGSKTHCGNKVDPDHKACEAAAMKAEW